MKRTVLCILLCICLLSAMALAVSAEESAPKLRPYRYAMEPIASNNELLEGFLYGSSGISAYSGNVMESRLDGTNRVMYLAAKTMAEKIAAGNWPEAVVRVPSASLVEPGTVYYAADLGVESLVEEIDGELYIAVAAMEAFYEAIGFDLSLIADAVRADCPYEMYWCGLNCYSLAYEAGWDAQTGEFFLFPAEEYAIVFEVVAPYWDSTEVYDPDYDLPHKVNTEKTVAAAAAVENADEILAEYAGADDCNKLQGYANALCELTDYNHTAVDQKMDYGDPWQIVYMFDNNPDTKVVCEGYAKSFLYLCQRTIFDGDIEAYTVSGRCGANSMGPHMWNTVHMDDDRTYLVDVTNLDTGFDLFLAVPTSGKYNGTYCVDGLYYQYDAQTLTLYTKRELELSKFAYGKDSCRGEHLETVVYKREATCSETGLIDRVCYRCGEVLASEIVPLLAHSEEIDEAVAASCTEAGKTEGKHCSVCSEVLTSQEIIPSLGHKEVIDNAIDATCTEAGKTEGKHCERCNEVLTAQEIIPMLGHSEATDEAIAATCTEAGKTESKYCDRCHVVLVAPETVPALGHTEVIDTEAMEATCTKDGATKGSHCSVCHVVLLESETIPAGHHKVTEALVPATPTQKGFTAGTYCDRCGEVFEGHEVIACPETVKLSSTSYTYDGNVKSPAVAVTDAEGNELVKNNDYTVTYAKGRKYVGAYKVTVAGKGNYDFTKELTFKINPPKTKISKLTAGSKSFKVTWSKKTTQVTGYQIQYSLKEDFSSSKTVTVSSAKTTSKTVSKLKGGKTYYVRVRTYKTVGKTKYYSGWSATKLIKTKK